MTALAVSGSAITVCAASSFIFTFAHPTYYVSAGITEKKLVTTNVAYVNMTSSTCSYGKTYFKIFLNDTTAMTYDAYCDNSAPQAISLYYYSNYYDYSGSVTLKAMNYNVDEIYTVTGEWNPNN